MTEKHVSAEDWNRRCAAFGSDAAEAARERWRSVAKPLGGLGLLEDAVIRIAGLTGDARYRLDKRAVAVFCADNGVVAQGVSQTGSEVTRILAANLLRGDISVCKMAAVARADVIGIDMGMLGAPLPGLLDRRIAAGSGDIGVGPAMTREQAARAVEHGIELAASLRRQGYAIVATGELGIGNTTTSSAVTAVLLGRKPSEVTGRGAGLSDAGMRRKVEVIEQAIAVNRPDADDPLDVLAKLGGFDIAGLAGLFIGGAIERLPVLIDGFIASVAALVALRLCPASGNAMLASHVSSEPASRALLEALALRPLICADMHLGEGTGAVAVLPLLDMALAVYNEMPTFEEMAIGRYQPFPERNGDRACNG